MISTRYRGDSYAWTSDKIYVSHGYFTDDDDEHQDCLGPVHYDVFCADRTTGKAKRLFQSVQAEAVQLFADQDDLYVTGIRMERMSGISTSRRNGTHIAMLSYTTRLRKRRKLRIPLLCRNIRRI